MRAWLISYVICGIAFTTTMYVKNLHKNNQSLTNEIKRLLKKDKTIVDRSLEIIGTSLALSAVSVLWIFFLGWLIYEKKFQKRNSEMTDEHKFNATKDTLISIIDPLAEEKNHIIKDPLNRVPDIPFGHLHQSWINFLSNTEPEDSIWSFEIKIGDMVTTWYSNEKRPSTRLIKGFACVSDGEIVNEFIYESS